MNQSFVVLIGVITAFLLICTIALLGNVADGKTSSQCFKEFYAWITSPKIKSYFKRLFS